MLSGQSGKPVVVKRSALGGKAVATVVADKAKEARTWARQRWPYGVTGEHRAGCPGAAAASRRGEGGLPATLRGAVARPNKGMEDLRR